MPSWVEVMRWTVVALATAALAILGVWMTGTGMAMVFGAELRKAAVSAVEVAGKVL